MIKPLRSSAFLTNLRRNHARKFWKGFTVNKTIADRMNPKTLREYAYWDGRPAKLEQMLCKDHYEDKKAQFAKL